MSDDVRLTLAQLPALQDGTDAWSALVDHVERRGSDLVVLPEMPFYRWLPGSRAVDEDAWTAAVEAHEDWLDRLDDLAPATVASSRPVIRDGTRLNEGFVWNSDDGYRSVHYKEHLPDEDGFWEASWYETGDGEFDLVEAAGLTVGFLICTELWAVERARAYGTRGVDLLVTPRATEAATSEKWLAAGRTCAVVAGAYSVSANRAPGPADSPQFGGRSWCFDPDGKQLGLTSEAQPFVTVDVDPSAPDRATETYPRYALDDVS